jgi:hypothetical protein
VDGMSSSWRRPYPHATMPRVARSKKNANGSGTGARRRKDGRYETRATLKPRPAAEG